MTNNQFFDQCLGRNRDYLERALQAVKDVPVDRLNKKPLNGDWSPLQIFRHLWLSNEPYLDKLAQEGMALPVDSTNEQVQLTGFGKFLATQAGPGTRAPAPRPLVPPEGMLTEAVIEEWAKQQLQLLDLIEGLRGRELNERFTRNPILKLFRMTLGDVLTVLTSHTERHVIQIEDRVQGSC